MSKNFVSLLLAIVVVVEAGRVPSITAAGSGTLLCQGGKLQFIPNPASCTSFYHCSNGAPNLKECPSGLFWDSSYDTCNYPGVTKCNVNGATSTTAAARPTTTAAVHPTTTAAARPTTTAAARPTTTEAVRPTTTAAALPVTTEAAPPTSTTSAPTTAAPKITTTPKATTTRAPPAGDLKCPAGVEFTYVAHPDTCTRFYLCKSGASSGPYNCGTNLWFNTAIQACVRVGLSDCKLNA